ncbi:DNA polymerase III subunit gamma/tau [Pseudanabaena galeata UHCC 0370]|uniref:DNA polymerase III subunit gamma/tau n=2 Tax=Pseudanabaena galeata TaxID=1112103 RepID=A0ABU5TR14_9CYAN|nr:DNA polymerase III subunit gamma/tau [Pseudanabaena galeata]MEA5480634.1 DNA polymerase III subunit gamma/tau [Pseudanabaena galeata UHCC 0370]
MLEHHRVPMGYEPLHHKYRPQIFDDLVGQEAIAHTLSNALNTKRIAPAYLFTGARGTGKTSSARIMAKSLNCLSSDSPTPHPCGKCELCHSIANGNALDITEIDAASNTGVDNIRELIERAQFAPVKARFKVYIIDECHMLSTAAFNALLKTLEEPPDRVTFILATTDPQRVLPTIISRCQRFDFRRIPLDAMVKHLGKIAANENINIHVEALTLVAQIAQGGLRDAESLLDQLSLLDGEITVEAVWDLVGSVPEQDLLSLIEAIAADHSTQLIDYVRRIMDRGREPLIVLQNLANVYRDLLIAKTASDRSDLVAMTSSGWERLIHLAQSLPIPNILLGQQHLRSAELQIRNSTQPRLWLEVTLMGLLPSAQGAIAQSQAPLPSQAQPFVPSRNIPATPQFTPQPPKNQPVSQVPVTSKPETTQIPIAKGSEPAHISTPIPAVETPISSGIDDLDNFAAVGYDLDQMWQNILSMLPTPTKSVFIQIQAHILTLESNSVKIGLGGKRDETTKNIVVQKRPELEEVFAKYLQRPIKVMFTFVTTPPQAEQVQVTAPLPVSPAIAPPPVIYQNPSPPPIPNQQPIATPSTEPPEKARSNQNHPQTPQPKGYVGMTEDDRVIKNLADLFNGQIVDLDEEPSEQ